MKWRAHETVAQYVQMVQQNQIFAVAAGVVVHQHTRVLMADLHERGDDMSVAGVQAGIQQLTAELAAAYKAAAVGDSEIQRVVEEYKSGPQGKAAVNTRVAEANAEVGHDTLRLCSVRGSDRSSAIESWDDSSGRAAEDSSGEFDGRRGHRGSKNAVAVG